MATTPSRPLDSRALKLLGPTMLAVGVLGIVVASMLTNHSDQVDVTVTGNPAIEDLIPPRDSEGFRQQEIGIDLAPGYEAELVIDGVAIPKDQMNVLRDLDNPSQSAATRGTFGSTLNRFTFQPLEGRVIEELLGDRHCVVATFWPLSNPDARQQEAWCFFSS